MTSHCAQSTSTIPPCRTDDSTVTISDPGEGDRKGIVVFFHPSQDSDPVLPLTVPNGIGENTGDLETAVVDAGWVFAYPATPQDFSIGGLGYPGSIFEDVSADVGNGGALTLRMLLSWDHISLYLDELYGPGHAKVIGGFSWGAWQAAQIAIGRTSDIAGYFCHCLPTIWENIGSEWLNGYDFGSIDCSGMDLGTTALNDVDVPGIIGYSTTDGLVGYSASSDPVSNTDDIITNAQGAGRSVTRYSSTQDAGTSYPDGHLFLGDDVTEYADWLGTTFPLEASF